MIKPKVLYQGVAQYYSKHEFDDYPTRDMIVTQWHESKEHTDKLLKKNFRKLLADTYRPPMTRPFITIQRKTIIDFGTHIGTKIEPSEIKKKQKNQHQHLYIKN